MRDQPRGTKGSLICCDQGNFELDTTKKQILFLFILMVIIGIKQQL